MDHLFVIICSASQSISTTSEASVRVLKSAIVTCQTMREGLQPSNWRRLTHIIRWVQSDYEADTQCGPYSIFNSPHIYTSAAVLRLLVNCPSLSLVLLSWCSPTAGGLKVQRHEKTLTFWIFIPFSQQQVSHLWRRLVFGSHSQIIGTKLTERRRTNLVRIKVLNNSCLQTEPQPVHSEEGCNTQKAKKREREKDCRWWKCWSVFGERDVQTYQNLILA